MNIQNSKTKLLISVLVMVFLLVSVGNALAIDWPERSIRLIVPFSAGGGSDRFTRALAPYLGEELGIEVIVENKPGAGSQVGLTTVYNADPNGYTIGQANQPHTTFTLINGDPPYELEDLAWLNMHHIDPVAMNAVNEKPWEDLNDFIDYVKEHPGEIAIGCTQNSGPQMVLIYLQEKFGLDYIIVPYPGGGEGRAALIGGHVDAYMGNVFANYSTRDQTKCLGVGWDERSELWPDAPSFAELFDDPEIVEFAKPMASFRGIYVRTEFKENYPERFDKLVEAYKKAYHSEGHMEAAEKQGQLPIMHWVGPEEATKLSQQTNEIVFEYSDRIGD